MSAQWTILSAAEVGRAHARAGAGCQDSVATTEIDGCVVIAVADGAGSAPLASVGATLATSLAISVATECLCGGVPERAGQWRDLLDGWLISVVRRFRAAAASVSRAVTTGAVLTGAGTARGWGPDTSAMAPNGDLATTLTMVLCRPPWISVGAIGDGFVVIRSQDGNLDLLLPPPDDIDRAPGATMFLTSPGALASAHRLVARVGDLAGIAVGSDGLDTLLVTYQAGRPRQPGAEPFGQLFGWAGASDGDEMRLARLLVSTGVCRLTEDDKTLVLAVPR